MISVPEFARIVVVGCLQYGGSVVSWIRSPARNASVGGHANSRHLLGLAADISFLPAQPGETPDDLRRRCVDCFAWLRDEGLHGYMRRGRQSLHIQDRGAKPPRARG